MAEQFLDMNGLAYYDGKVKAELAKKADKTDIPTTAADVGAIPVSEADTFAKKSDISNVYKYKGSVDDYDSLPTEDLTAGDVYNVEDDGMNYGWTGDAWDALGMSFSIDSITNAEIDALFTTENE